MWTWRSPWSSQGQRPKVCAAGSDTAGQWRGPPFPASRPHLIGTAHPGQLATSICPECPVWVGPRLLPSSALAIVASQEIAARLGTPMSWGPALTHPLPPCPPQACFCCGMGAQGWPHLPWRPWVSRVLKGGVSIARLQAAPHPGASHQHLLMPCSLGCFRAMQTGSGRRLDPEAWCRPGWDCPRGPIPPAVWVAGCLALQRVCTPQSLRRQLSWAQAPDDHATRRVPGQASCLLRPRVASS